MTSGDEPQGLASHLAGKKLRPVVIHTDQTADDDSRNLLRDGMSAVFVESLLTMRNVSHAAGISRCEGRLDSFRRLTV